MTNSFGCQPRRATLLADRGAALRAILRSYGKTMQHGGMRYGISYLGSAFPLRVAGLSNSARAWGFWMICSMTAVHASSCWIIATPYIRERARPMSTRCRHVLWSPEGLARLHAEPPSYDWFIALAVFWHVEDSTAAALIR